MQSTTVLWSLTLAAELDRPEILDMLLDDGRVDPTQNRHMVLYHATAWDNPKCVIILNKHGYFNTKVFMEGMRMVYTEQAYMCK
jgi:hypothetical protein